jgi:hypothetical protein
LGGIILIEVTPKHCSVNFRPPTTTVSFVIDRDDANRFSPLVGDLVNYSLVLKKKRNKSINMHNYMWVLCDKIAQARHDMMVLTKEDIYRMAVREAGLWNDVTVDNQNTKDLIADWQRNGIGWFAEVVFRGDEYTTLRLYRGASVYTADQLYRLTDYVVEMAKENGIDTISDAELKRLKELWNG